MIKLLNPRKKMNRRNSYKFPSVVVKNKMATKKLKLPGTFGNRGADIPVLRYKQIKLRMNNS